MLNDINRDEVTADWLDWFESSMPKKSPAQWAGLSQSDRL